jgi:hypothetical protein
MNRLFDKAKRDRQRLRWLGTRPVDDVRAAERRALSASKPSRARASPAGLVPVGSIR